MGRPLSAILTLNTIANTLGAVGVGAEAHRLFGGGFVALFSALLTLTILIAAEIIPKTLGSVYWRSLLPFAVYCIQALIVICWPFVRLSRYLSRLFRASSIVVTREDIKGLVRAGADEGAIYANEEDILINILNLKQKKVLDIMTPRTVITAFKKSMTIAEVLKKYQPLRFSRIPVYEESLDQIIGIIHRYKILEANLQGCDKITVGSYVKPVHSVPETMSVSAALNQFIKRKEHIFIVVDEYGAISGIVTMEDVVETALGIEIVDELDSVADLREEARKEWALRKQKARAFGKNP